MRKTIQPPLLLTPDFEPDEPVHSTEEPACGWPAELARIDRILALRLSENAATRRLLREGRYCLTTCRTGETPAERAKREAEAQAAFPAAQARAFELLRARLEGPAARAARARLTAEAICGRALTDVDLAEVGADVLQQARAILKLELDLATYLYDRHAKAADHARRIVANYPGTPRAKLYAPTLALEEKAMSEAAPRMLAAEKACIAAGMVIDLALERAPLQ